MTPQFVDIKEVKRIAVQLFELLETRGVAQIRVEDPQYWTVFPEAREPTEKPLPVMGDVMDDLDDSRAEAAGPADTLVIWHAFNHLAGLMKLIARADMNGDLIEGGCP
jgi:hypothetical protein